MAFHAMVHLTGRDGQLSTIWERPAVATLAAAEPLVKSAIAKARRVGGKNLTIDVYDDLAGACAWRGRVKT